MSNAQPIYLLADSQPLFPRGDRPSILREIADLLPRRHQRAAYVGASNGDDPRFFSIFESALHTVGMTERRQVMASFCDLNADYLRSADLILLAGGDVARGWDALVRTGMREVIRQRYESGAILVGVSAGAVQLGLGGNYALDVQPASELRTFGFVEHWIDVHDESADWSRLRRFLSLTGSGAVGFGIPTGAALVCGSAGELAPRIAPVTRFTVRPTGVSGEAIEATSRLFDRPTV